MRKILFLMCFIPAMILSAGSAAWAQTPDGQTPAEETVCDLQSGAAFGLCNAYCEAMDCDSLDPNASPNACDRVAANYKKITNSDISCAIACSDEDQCGNCATPQDTDTCCTAHNNDPNNPFPACEPPPPAACTDEDQCGNCATPQDTEACCMAHNNDPNNPFPACDDGGSCSLPDDCTACAGTELTECCNNQPFALGCVD